MLIKKGNLIQDFVMFEHVIKINHTQVIVNIWRESNRSNRNVSEGKGVAVASRFVGGLLEYEHQS